MLVIGQRPQQVQLDLLGGWVLLLQRPLQQDLEVAGLGVVPELAGMAVHAPLPHLGAVLMRDACPDQVLQFRRARHLPVHRAGKVVFPLDARGDLLARGEVQALQVQGPNLGD